MGEIDALLERYRRVLESSTNKVFYESVIELVKLWPAESLLSSTSAVDERFFKSVLYFQFKCNQKQHKTTSYAHFS